jgi:hypothetical protein
MKCASCGFEGEMGSGVGSAIVIGRRDECPKCHADLHSCINCLHHDQKAYNECVETQADPVKVKDRSNFCDYFTPNLGKTGVSGGSTDKNSRENLLKAAESLFKKKSGV